MDQSKPLVIGKRGVQSSGTTVEVTAPTWKLIMVFPDEQRATHIAKMFEESILGELPESAAATRERKALILNQLGMCARYLIFRERGLIRSNDRCRAPGANTPRSTKTSPAERRSPLAIVRCIARQLFREFAFRAGRFHTAQEASKEQIR
jgi:hypothetical protein